VKTYTAKSAEREDVTVKSRQNCSAPTFSQIMQPSSEFQTVSSVS